MTHSRYVLAKLLIGVLAAACFPALKAQIFQSTSVQTIPDAPNPGIANDIRVSGTTGGSVLPKRVTLNITHPNVSDLQILLIPPNTQWPALEFSAASVPLAVANGIIALSTGNGGSGDDYTNTRLVFPKDNNYDQSGAPSITTGTAPFTGTFLAEGLAFFGGSFPINGSWRLVVIDSQGSQAGVLNSWSIEFSISAGPDMYVDDLGLNFGRFYAIVNNSTFDFPEARPVGVAFSQEWEVMNLGDAMLTFSGTPSVSTSVAINCVASITQQPLNQLFGGGGSGFIWSCSPAAPGPFSFQISMPNDDPDESAMSFTIAGNAIAAAAPEINIERPFGLSNSRFDGGQDSFGPTFAGVTQNISYTIRNKGSAALALLGGPAFVSIGALANCTASISTQPPVAGSVAPGANVSFTLSVTPAAVGAWSVGWSLQNNDADEPIFDLNVSGVAATGGVPDAHVRVGSDIPDGGIDMVSPLPLGPISRQFILQNLGNSLLSLSGSPFVSIFNSVNCSVVINSQPAATVSFGTSTAFFCTITPAAVGVWSYEWSFSSNDPDEATYNATTSGNALDVPECDVSRAGPLADGGTDTVTGATIGNAMVLTYTISNSGAPGSMLSLITPCLPATSQANCTVSIATQPVSSVAGGASTILVMNVTPMASGIFLFLLTFTCNDANEGTYNWMVTGSASATGQPECDVSRVGPVADGGIDTVTGAVSQTAMTLTYTVTNSGPVGLTLAIPVANPGSTLNCTASITLQPTSPVPVGSGRALEVTLTPISGGPFSCSISFGNSDPNENPYNWTIQGTAVGPAPEMDVLRVALAVVDGGPADALGNVPVGQMQTVVYSIVNTGTAPLILTGSPNLILVAPAVNVATLGVSAQPAATIAPGVLASFSVTFSTAIVGAFVFSVSIDNNDFNENPYNWLVSGTSVLAPEIELARVGAIPDGGADSIANAVAGSTTTLTYVLSNTGTAALSILTPVTLSALNNCVAVVTNQPAGSVAAGGTTNLVISVTPAGPGAFGFEVNISNSDANENPYHWIATGSAAALGGSPPTGGTDKAGGCSTAGWGGNGCFSLGLVSLALLAWRKRPRRQS